MTRKTTDIAAQPVERAQLHNKTSSEKQSEIIAGSDRSQKLLGRRSLRLHLPLGLVGNTDDKPADEHDREKSKDCHERALTPSNARTRTVQHAFAGCEMSVFDRLAAPRRMRKLLALTVQSSRPKKSRSCSCLIFQHSGRSSPEESSDGGFNGGSSMKVAAKGCVCRGCYSARGPYR